MARMPGAHWWGEHSPKIPMLHYDIVCIHTIVGYAPAHAAHFSTHHDGRIDQSRDTRYRSGANLNGNHRVIAIENEDHGSAYGDWNVNDGHAVPSFTSAQIEAISQICAWAHVAHGIPLVPCPNSKPDSRGIAYHRQGIDGDFSDYAYPGRVSGGEIWTLSPGKVCPGDRRIKQTLELIIPRAIEIIEETDMPTADEIAAAVWTGQSYPDKLRDDIPDVPDGDVRDPIAYFNALRTQVSQMRADIAWIKTKLATPTPPPGTVTVGAISPEALAAQAKANADETAVRMKP